MDSTQKIYSTGQWRYSLWERYLNIFSSVTVASRMADFPEHSHNGLEPSSGPNVSFVEIPSLSSPLAFFGRRSRAAEKLEKALEEADALIARLPSEIGSLAIKIAERLGKPWAVELVGCAWNSLWNHGKWLAKIYAPYAMWRTKAILRRASYASYVTQKFLQNRYPCYGVTKGFSEINIGEMDEKVLEKRLVKIKNGHFPLKIGMIGSMATNYKGIDTALKAIHRGRDELPPFEFRILGEGDERPWKILAQDLGVAEHVTFCGTLPGGPPVFRWLDEIDLFIQPSRAEGLPRALIEAMSRGCPALGSTVGGIPELLEDSCLHHPKDIQKLSELLVRNLKDKIWQCEQAQKNYMIAKRYDITISEAVQQNFLHEFYKTVKKSSSI